MRKKIFLLILIVFIFMLLTINFDVYATTQQDEQSHAQQELQDSIDGQLSNINFNELDRILSNFSDEQNQIFNSSNILAKIKSLINGEVATDYNSFFKYIITIVFDNALIFIPIFCLIIAIAVLCSFSENLSPNKKNKSITNLIYFVCFGVIIVIVFANVTSLISLTKGVLESLSTQIQVIFPILLTLMTATQSLVSVSAYQPAVAFLSSSITVIFSNILIPLFIFCLIFNVVGNLSPNIKLEKISKFFSSLFKWIIGIVFTIFVSFLTIQGITAGTVDGVSIKTAKFAIKSYVPILGGYLSDGISLILTSSVLIKNAVGATGLILLFATVLLPLLKILVFMFGLKLVAGIIEPLGESRIANFIYGISKCLNMLIACILGVAFMYLITVGLVMCSANVF